MNKIKKTYLLLALIILLIVGGVIFFATYNTKPTEFECEIALANFLRLQKMPNVTHTQINKRIENDPVVRKMIKMCMENKPKKQIQCEMSAYDLNALANCKKLIDKE